MKITLRKAAKLRNRIQHVLSTIDDESTRTNVAIKVMDPDATEQINKLSEKFRNNHARYTTLNKVLFTIREKLAEANDASGVSRLLTKKERWAREAQFIGRYENIRPENLLPTEEQLKARIQSAKEHLNVSESYHDTMVVGIVSESTIQSLKDEIREAEKHINDCQEQIENLNSTHQIELTDMELSVLDQEKISL